MSNDKYQINTNDWSLEIRNWKLEIPCLSGAGFTLIELLVVVSLMGVMIFVTLVSYTNYTTRQTLKTGADELRETLNLAKSRALSQVKPEVCDDTDALEGYRVQICNVHGTSCESASDYELQVVCGGRPYLVEPKRLPQNVSFDERTERTSFFFPVLSQGVEAPGVVVLSGFGKSLTITVDTLGNVTFSP